ncbi:SIR2 family NAD-dependent protein deacylase [Aliarcobacter cryaerophilus]|uniref:SIR2 family NAD-dependent protein deacylase n=1 Tax=Aliarcobacter cryaerophilus TaxID=28198 RepID=UPI0018680E55|nr:SIR2 family protein [Aliarcobacter cryaerophilus]
MIENLKKILKEEDTILFIGSGVSLWSGLPSWTELINELIEFLKKNGLKANLTEQESLRGDLLQAASYGFDKLSKSKFAEFIRESCRVNSAKPHDIHNKIISLGPNCYITTNYDTLIESSLQKWNQETYFRKVVNKQLTETAEIVGARAKNFIFKLHGDVEDSDSIILTREQYRTLNYGGELHHALETTKILMVSRPIVYIGFGLRDTDFLYLKDLLINTYKGGTRDHYAIMPDVSEEEKEYWSRNYGIHLIDYKTIVRKDGTRDHSPILTLLDELQSTKIEVQTSELILNSELVLNLSRHAAKYFGFESSKLHLPLVVNETKNKNAKFYPHQYHEASVESILDNGPEKLILIGLPGGGKSYSLKASVERLAKALNAECIEDKIKITETIIPIYIDLKLYQGNIIDLIEQNIPVGKSIELLFSNFKVKLYLDGFNEIPKEYIESNHWNSDINDLLEKMSFSLVISSRTIDGLENIDFPIFSLDSINKDFVKTSLAKNELELHGIFKDEIIELLQKPFYYKLIFENELKIFSEISPQKIYSDLLKLINGKFHKRFDINLDLVSPLSKAALNAIDKGEEAYKIEKLKEFIEVEFKNHQEFPFSSSEIVNWLISQNFLIPLPNGRISFFHQSVTEYLAATQLAVLFSNNNKILKEKLIYRRWDQALFLTLSLLEKKEADKFLNTIINIDFELALSSIKYFEGDTQEFVNYFLKEINNMSIKEFETIHRIVNILEKKVPYSELHIPALKALVRKGNSLGGIAVGCLLNLIGYSFKEEALSLLVENCDDYNFCTSIARSIKKYISEDDIPKLILYCNKVQEKLNSGNIETFVGFDSALGNILNGFNPNLVCHTLYDSKTSKEDQKVQINVICNFLQNCKSNESLENAVNLLLLGIDETSFVIYCILNFTPLEENIDYSIFNKEHIKALLSILKHNENKNSEWALDSITCICSKREDLIHIIQEEIKISKLILKAALYYSISKEKKYNLVFETLEELLDIDSETLSKEPFNFIRHMDELDWRGQEILFVKLLKLRNMELAYNLCDELSIYNRFKDQLIFEFGSIKWWLDWFTEYFESKSDEWMFIDRVPKVISRNITAEKRDEYLREFNNPDSQYRKVLIRTILDNLYNLTINDLTEESIEYLLDDLKIIKLNYFYKNNILYTIATETFVNKYLIPRLKSAENTEYENLINLIEKIGKKHKKRYLVEYKI